jgi:ketosteroid isomerase-like protein
VAEDKVAIVRRLYEANCSGPPETTVEVALSLVDPAFEFRSRVAAVEGSMYRGYEGARKYFADMADAWREWQNEPGEIIDVGRDAVLVDSTFRGVGKESGVEVELRSAIVFVVARGKVVRGLSYPTREEALAAAGIPE